MALRLHERGLRAMMGMAEALPIVEISRRATVFYLDDVIGIETMPGRRVLTALTRDQDCLATPAGAIKNRATPSLVFGCLIPFSSGFALLTGEETRQSLDQRRELTQAHVGVAGPTASICQRRKASRPRAVISPAWVKKPASISLCRAAGSNSRQWSS
jgi:hypothetical protein